MAFPSSIPLSSKLGLIDQDGYALAIVRQPGYLFRWHRHDCAMLLWPRTGAFDSAWHHGDNVRHSRLARGQALLLPAHVAHSTRSRDAVAQHGELYLTPTLIKGNEATGALQLDGAAQAMLDALWAPALTAGALSRLVSALVEQLAVSHAAAPLNGAGVLARRWRDELRGLLAAGKTLPTIAQSAASLGVSVRTLERACSEHYDCTPVTLRRLLLADAARRRLQMGQSLASVSVELGFASSGHLGRLLRSVPATLTPVP